MNKCTCSVDPQVTCIVHPTYVSLKKRVGELEKQLHGTVTTKYHDEIVDSAVRVIANLEKKWSLIYRGYDVFKECRTVPATYVSDVLDAIDRLAKKEEGKNG